MPTKTKFESRYTEPATVREPYTEEVRAHMLRKGDGIGAKAIAELVIGHKFVTAKGTGGEQLLRVPLESEVTVTRTRETKESRKATKRYMNNRGLERRLEGDLNSGYHDAVQKLNERVQQDYQVDYQIIGSILEHQAEAKLWRGYAAMVEYAHDSETKDDWELKGADHHDLMIAYLKELRDQLANKYMHRAISRSSNVLSNLMEDVDRSAVAEFIDNAKWGWY